MRQDLERNGRSPAKILVDNTVEGTPEISKVIAADRIEIRKRHFPNKTAGLFRYTILVLIC
jgi:hypothetical protein